ncbi:MAG: MOSC domain-containing protein [Streptomycetaceae bacterium]|nr:MOSC domain-containing protein [Mycobacteriaceae bacterium]NUS57260.1 MOSC domain-containing protein [Streptomycetaceae bacterium]
MPGILEAVCIVHTEHDLGKRNLRSAIDKRPVDGPVEIRELGPAGDHVCDTKHHGGVHQAVYAYAEEDAQRWSSELGRPVPAGWFGENLRISGLPVSDAVFGAHWAIGDVLLEVSAPRVPCATFQNWTGEQQWVKRFTLRSDTGAYFRVRVPGTVRAGDAVRIVHTPAHGITVRDLFTGADPDRLHRLRTEEPTVSDDVIRQIDRHLRILNASSLHNAPSLQTE